MPAISVIIPLYNKAGTIRRAVQSVLGQSFGDFDVSIVDDGGTDASLAALAGVSDERIRIIRQSNNGPGAARNEGARQSTSPLLAFLDADDEWEPGYLRTSVDRLDAHPTVAAHISAYFKGSDKSSTEADNIAFGITAGPWRVDPSSRNKATKRYVDFCHSSCVVVRRPVFDRYGGFYERNRCLYGEDSYLWLMLVVNHTLFLDPRPLVWFHSEDSSLGERMRGNHPLRPALSDPEPLRLRCDPARREVLEDLLAYYRLIETEKLVKQGNYADIRMLRRRFPLRRGVDADLRKREFRVEWRKFLSWAGLAN